MLYVPFLHRGTLMPQIGEHRAVLLTDLLEEAVNLEQVCCPHEDRTDRIGLAHGPPHAGRHPASTMRAATTNPAPSAAIRASTTSARLLNTQGPVDGDAEIGATFT